MKYLKAQDVLPAELVEELQKYAGGNIIYVPKPKHTHHRWGELSGTREYVDQRNLTIREKYRDGHDTQMLAQEFCLSIDSIKKIIYSQ